MLSECPAKLRLTSERFGAELSYEFRRKHFCVNKIKKGGLFGVKQTFQRRFLRHVTDVDVSRAAKGVKKYNTCIRGNGVIRGYRRKNMALRHCNSVVRHCRSMDRQTRPIRCSSPTSRRSEHLRVYGLESPKNCTKNCKVSE